MFKFNNTHIFTGYLKQKLSTTNIPTCKIYTKEFTDYRIAHGKEDPRIIESVELANSGDISKIQRVATRINYLRDGELYHYLWKYDSTKEDLGHDATSWKRSCIDFYNSEKAKPGLTKTLYSPGCYYDTTTHEYLGEYLRFLRDFHNVNLMSLYNCFNNSICSNLYINPLNQSRILFDSQDANYRIYAIPVKLFSNYTIALDSFQGIEMCCGLYNSKLYKSTMVEDLIKKTFVKVNRAAFKQPFLFDKLDVKNWSYETDIVNDLDAKEDTISRWDIIKHEKDLKLFIKVPSSCKSSIVILEGDYRNFNDFKYIPMIASKSNEVAWTFLHNRSISNFNAEDLPNDINDIAFTPISKVQLLELNTGESYPFADRLVEYLSGSAITSIDEIPDNIKRAQRTMSQNNHYFKIEGLWEEKMQKIVYDYLMNSGPMEIDENGELVDRRRGYHARLGHTNKSTLYDILGYVDKEAEKWYASWVKQNSRAAVKDTIQNIDIYDKLYDI